MKIKGGKSILNTEIQQQALHSYQQINLSYMVTSTMFNIPLIFLDSRSHTQSLRYTGNTLNRMNAEELKAKHGLMKPPFPEKSKS